MASFDVGGIVGGLGKSPSTISVLHVVRNELLGILKRAANRGQILDHCNVELMVEEAMLESNLVQSVDEILSNCASASSLTNGLLNTTTQAAPNRTSSSSDDTISSAKNERKIKMLSKLSKKANETLLKARRGGASSGCGKNETRYIVKKIIFDGLEELTYKYVAASSSSDDDAESLTEQRDEMIKFIKTPKMEFGGSSSSHESNRFFGETQEGVGTAKSAPPTTKEPNADHLSEMTLVASEHGDELIGDCHFAADKPQKTKENVSVIRMSEICVSTTQLDDSTVHFNEICETKVKSTNSGDKLNIEASRSIVRMSEVCETARRALCTVCRAKKLELDFVNKKLRRVKSCIVVKSMECMEATPPSATSQLIKEMKLEDLVNTSLKAQHTETQSRTKAGESRNLNKSLAGDLVGSTKRDHITNEATAELTNFETPLKSVPLKITLLKNKVNQEKTEKAALKSIKCKLNKIKSDPEPNENEKLKREIEKFFEKCSKSEPDRLRIIKTKLPVKLNVKKLQPKEKEEQQPQKKPATTQAPIPAMSKLWPTVQQTNTATTQNNATTSVPAPPADDADANAETEAPAPIVLMSEMWMTTAPKKTNGNEQKRFATLIQCEAELTVEEEEEVRDESPLPVKSGTKSRFSHIKSFLDEEKNRRLITLKTKKPPPHPLTPDLQTKMLTAEWLSIAKQLKREQLSTMGENPELQAGGKAAQQQQMQQQEQKEAKQAKKAQKQQQQQQQQQQMPPQAAQTKDAAKSFDMLKTSSMKSNWSAAGLGEKSQITAQIAAQQKPLPTKLNDNGTNDIKSNNNHNNHNGNISCNKPVTVKPTWSSLVRKWGSETAELKAQKHQPQQPEPLPLQPRLSCSNATSSTLCAKSQQNSSALTSLKASVLTLVPHLEADKADKAVEGKLSRHADGASDTNIVVMSRAQSTSPISRRSSTCQRKKPGVKQVVSFKKKPLKEPTVFQRKENFLKTVETMNFMLDASDTVRTIDDGLDEQDLLNFRWNLEYQKREEAKRKAGKYDAATTMLTSIAGPPLNEVQTQTELPRMMSNVTTPKYAPSPPTASSSPPKTPSSTAAAAVLATEIFASQSARSRTPPSNSATDSKVSPIKDSEPQIKLIDEIEFISSTNDEATNKPTAHQHQQQAQQRLLTPLELELLSKDYFSTLLDEIRDLLQTTNLLSAKAFSSEPLTLWDVREAGRKVVQLRVVKTSLGAKRMTFLVNIDKALQKQIEIMKTIVAYGKIIFPRDIRTNPAEEEEAQLQKLLNEYQQKNAQTPQHPTAPQPPHPNDEPHKKVYNKKINEALAAQQIRLQRTANTQALNQYKLEMDKRARINAQAYKQQTYPPVRTTNSMCYTPKFTQTFLQSTSAKHNTPEETSTPPPPPPPPPSLPNYGQESMQQQHGANDNATSAAAGVGSYQHFDYLSDIDDMSSEYMCKPRNRKAAKRAKKPKQAAKPLEFQLTGFKHNNKKHNNHNVHRRYHQQQQQQQQEQQLQQQQQQPQQYPNNYLLSSSLSKRPNAKRSKKAKPNVENVLNNNSPPPTVRVPAKNAPYTRTSYVLPVPPHQPTGWELFKWNCGQLNDEASVRARFFAEKNCGGSSAFVNAQERLKNHFVRNEFKTTSAQGYRFQAPPPIWK